MRKDKRAEEPEEQASWLTTYGDMVTLLLTFFVLMFAISSVDAKKFALLAKGLSREGITAEQFLEIQADHDEMAGVGEPDPEDIEFPGVTDTQTPDEGKEEGNEELGKLYTLIKFHIEDNNLQDSISVVYNGDNLLLTLTNDIWFVSGSAQITADMRENGATLAQLLRDTQSETDPFEIIVVGHTDNLPIHTSKYPSNWYLSVDRAVAFLDVLLTDSGLSPVYFSARGCGEVVPIADNDTEEGRQKNRRVEVLISQPKKQG